MEIVRKIDEKNEKFKNIGYGAVFMSDNVCYIKISGEAKITNDLFVNAISLEDGAMMGFKDYHEVRVVKATLTIED